MNSLPALLRANPGLTVAMAMCLGFPLVLSLLALVLRAAGASLRPLVFIAGLLLPLAALFLVAGLINARTPSTPSESSFALTVTNGQFANRASLFGPDIPNANFRDAKSAFPEFFGEAEHAELGAVGNGDNVFVAQFPTSDAAKRAAQFLWKWFRVTDTRGDELHGWRGKRGLNQDFFEMLRSGRLLFLWTAQTEQACAARRAASAAATEALDATPTPVLPVLPAPLFPALQPLGTWFQSTGMKVAGVLLMVALYTLSFFKGAAWASRTPAASGVPHLTASQLTARLEAINALDVPFRIERAPQPNQLHASWRYADAKWFDLARANGLRRTFRLRLTLDEASRTVRTTDEVAEFDWAAGRDGARLEWKAITGIVFFHAEQRRIVGLQLDQHGRFQPNLSYAYKFNLDELKSPLVATVTRAGWTWSPTVWQGPSWLRWLTN